MDPDGIARAVLVNSPSPEQMGFTHDANEYVTRYCAEAPDRLIAMGGVHPRFAEDAGAEVRRAVAPGVRALKGHPPHMGFAAHAYLHGLDGLRAIYEKGHRLRVPGVIHTRTSILPRGRTRLREPHGRCHPA